MEAAPRQQKYLRAAEINVHFNADLQSIIHFVIHLNVFCVFSSISFMVSCLTFKYLICSELSSALLRYN